MKKKEIFAKMSRSFANVYFANKTLWTEEEVNDEKRREDDWLVILERAVNY